MSKKHKSKKTIKSKNKTNNNQITNSQTSKKQTHSVFFTLFTHNIPINDQFKQWNNGCQQGSCEIFSGSNDKIIINNSGNYNISYEISGDIKEIEHISKFETTILFNRQSSGDTIIRTDEHGDQAPPNNSSSYDFRTDIIKIDNVNLIKGDYLYIKYNMIIYKNTLIGSGNLDLYCNLMLTKN